MYTWLANKHSVGVTTGAWNLIIHPPIFLDCPVFWGIDLDLA
ncbi:hypothetical protein [Pantanalinema sp. GBBB05]